MKGQIRCGNKKCQTVRTTDVCPKCGGVHCYVRLYWEGERYTYRHYVGERLYYETANRLLSTIRMKIDAGTFNPEDYLSTVIEEKKVKKQIEVWIAQKETEASNNELSYETLKNYKGYAKHHITPLLGELDVQLQYENIENFKDKLPKQLKLKTKRNILTALHAFLAWLKLTGVITVVPSFPVIKGEDATVRQALAVEEQLEGLKKIPQEHKDVIEFGFETGLRGGEACALKLKDIDLKKKTALIQRTFSGARLKETTKGKRKAQIPLSDRALEIARKHVTKQFTGIPDITVFENFLFINPDTNRRYTTKKLNQLWRTYSGRNTTYYEASRHSFCTQIVETGADTFTAQRLMRHADLRSTQKYFHATEEHLFEAVNRRGVPKCTEVVSKQIN